MRWFSPLFTSAIAVISLVVLAFLLTSCATSTYKPSMPPCYINGQKGVWASTNSGESYRCVSQLETARWLERMGYGR